MSTFKDLCIKNSEYLKINLIYLRITIRIKRTILYI